MTVTVLCLAVVDDVAEIVQGMCMCTMVMVQYLVIVVVVTEAF